MIMNNPVFFSYRLEQDFFPYIWEIPVFVQSLLIKHKGVPSA